MFDLLNRAATALARDVSPLSSVVKALICRMVAGIAVYATLAGPIEAAELTEGNFSNTVIMKGIIESGDYDKVHSYIEAHVFTNSIYLASPGGNLVEAIKIGRLLRRLRFETTIPSFMQSRPEITIPLSISKEHYVCASACFFLFVAGVHRITVLDSDDDVPYLGVHRPFFTNDDLIALGANKAIDSANQLRLFVESYLKEMDVSAKYAEIMFSVPNEQIRWITGAEFKADLAGYIPGLKEWIDSVCNRKSNLDRAQLIDKEVEEYIRDHPLRGTPPAEAEVPPTERPTPEGPRLNIDQRSFCESDELSHLSREAYLKEFRH